NAMGQDPSDGTGPERPGPGDTGKPSDGDLTHVLHLCAEQPGAHRTGPFGPDPLVFRNGRKMFALVAQDRQPEMLTVKCEPEAGRQLIDQFESIVPGYHMNKLHWISIRLDGTVPRDLLEELIMNSYDLVGGGKIL
ncbi:MAG: hypothetical protein QG608_2632, partial [Actinomycetota bacterium]|nr:hypothetical protein [Actinomycetota bacterium]